jgi:hypothetical protein
MTYTSYFLFEEQPTGYFDGFAPTLFRLIIQTTSLALMYLEYGTALNGQIKNIYVALPNLLMVAAITLINVVVLSHSLAYDQ